MNKTPNLNQSYLNLNDIRKHSNMWKNVAFPFQAILIRQNPFDNQYSSNVVLSSSPESSLAIFYTYYIPLLFLTLLSITT